MHYFITQAKNAPTVFRVYIFLFLCLSFSNSSYSQEPFTKSDSITVGFILANQYFERWQREKHYFEQELNKLGGKVIFKDCYDQPDNQVTAVKELINDSVDLVIIIPIDAVKAAEVVLLAKEAGIKTIAYDRLILNCPLDYYITYNSESVGEMMAYTIKNELPEGNILYVGGPTDDHNSVLIRKGVFNVFGPLKKKYNLFEVEVSSWTELDAYLQIDNYLTKNDSLPDAIICASDVLTRGAINILVEMDALGRVKLTGQDAELDICKHVVQGNVEVSIYKPGKRLAEITANEVIQILSDATYLYSETINNGHRDVPSLLLEPLKVTKNNISKTVIKDNYYTREQIYPDSE